jgi:heme/copper-type cytochrome/quinol oxidase subunit 2
MRHLLGDAIFGIAAICCLAAQVAIVRSTLRPYTAATDGERASSPVPRPRTAIELVWVLLPALVLAGVFALTWHAMHPPQPGPAIQLSTAVWPLPR